MHSKNSNPIIMPRNGTQVSGHLDNANGLSREVIRCVDEKRKNENETAISKSGNSMKNARRHARHVRVGRKLEKSKHATVLPKNSRRNTPKARAVSRVRAILRCHSRRYESGAR